jgi:choline dehydrogenase-like flavoprotein
MSDAGQYDVVVVGAGVAGALMAKYLTCAGLRVLILEAGPATAQSFAGYMKHLDDFYVASSKGPESAWPPDLNAPQPDTADLRNNNGYFVQKGPNLYGSSYSRLQGGSTLHWLGVSLRMLPEDFAMRSRYGVGRDWPLGYDDLEPYYCKAEHEIGVSADKADQAYLGNHFPDEYEYPMRRVPLSYSDQKLAQAVDGMKITVGDVTRPVKIRSYPAARNSTPRGDYVPLGAFDVRSDGEVENMHVGERCAGNTACTPICPIQAKYNAGKTLAQSNRSKLKILEKAVASKINFNSADGAVTSISYKRYDGPAVTNCEAVGRVYILAAHAVENAKLMLVSDLPNSSGLIGKTLMDHPALYVWGLAPKPVGPYRGPLSTSGLEEFRQGDFRKEQAAFRFDIGNDGWRATTGAPDTTVVDAVIKQNLFGKKLHGYLASKLPFHVRFSLAVEQLPDPFNCVSIDRTIVDPLGIPRPVIQYRIDEYTQKGWVEARRVAREMFEHAGIEDHSTVIQGAPAVQVKGEVFSYHGMGHFAGTHAMGVDPRQSVVDAYQRSWDHRNLFLIGSGSFPTMGTSNPTLTLAALAIRTAEHLIAELTA